MRVAWLITMVLALSPAPSHASVTAQQAQELDRTLTPVGAERARNASGTIPAWSGGGMPPGLAAEAPLFTIDAAHAAQYKEELPEGALALFHAFPDYRMRVFPSHRTAAAPPSVYAAIRANAVRAHPAPDGIAYGVADTAGGVPFPIPTSGTEIVWNHLLAFWGVAREAHVGTYIASGDGTIQQTAGYREVTDFPYYHASSPQEVGACYFKTRRVQDAGHPAWARPISHGSRWMSGAIATWPGATFPVSTACERHPPCRTTRRIRMPRVMRSLTITISSLAAPTVTIFVYSASERCWCPTTMMR
jgi:hypothetical protein